MKLVPFWLLVTFLTLTQDAPQSAASPANRSEDNNTIRYGEWSRWSACDERCHQMKVRLCVSGACEESKLMKERKCPGCGTKVRIVHKLLNFFGFGDSDDSIYSDYDEDYGEHWVNSQRNDPEADEGFEAFFRGLFHSFDFEWGNPVSSTPSNTLDDDDEEEEVEVFSGVPEVETVDFPADHSCGVTSNERYSKMMAKIIGGRNSKRGRWPWQVALYNQEYENFFCGGTLISKSWVVTAAHCLLSDFGNDVTVVAGLHDTGNLDDSSYSLHLIRERVIHPRYDSETNDNDIALLRLANDVKPGDDVGFACLPSYHQASPGRDQVCKVLGWGRGTHRTTLQEADMHIQSSRSCKRHYFGTGNHITPHMLCASSRNYVSDTCGGDSGGPLLCRDAKSPAKPWTLFGITSFGDDCTVSESPGVYTRVAVFRKWIAATMECDGSCDPVA
ncbi:transmembrane protease serine 9-like [Phlebotomus argentipes]|uniref:transmembrane protease serine 9-like n=1 Tax=Phlebotomus argentipes TaxID=94469 RepID=UPI002892AA57|nr:transmembrane protease serine 9-like [Phlebotomus argentipes]